jgi:hypothetical protein
MPTLLRILTGGTVQDLQLDGAAPIPRMGEIVEIGSADGVGPERLEVTEVRYVLADGVLSAVVECRAPTIGLANQGPGLMR